MHEHTGIKVAGTITDSLRFRLPFRHAPVSRPTARIGILVLLMAAISVPSFRQPTFHADDETRKPTAEIQALQLERLEVLKRIVALKMETYREGEQEFQAVDNDGSRIAACGRSAHSYQGAGINA